MKAAVWTDINKIEIKELPIPEIGENEALVKVIAAGVCVTDYHVISGKLKIGRPPNVQGHEICGEVVKINGKKDGVKIGTRCVIMTSLGCGKCEACKSGKPYLCNDSAEIGYYPYNGGYAEYVKVAIDSVIPIPDSVSDLSAAIMESCVCPTESLLRIGVSENDRVLVTGNGPAALSYITVLKVLGAKQIISAIRNKDKENLVKEYGATDVIISTDLKEAEKEVVKITGGLKASLVIEATGAVSVIENAINFVSKGGKIIQYGICGDNDKVYMPVKKLVTEEITLYGAVGNTSAWYPLIEWISKGKLDLEKMVTHTFALDEINKAFDLYRNHDRKLIKAVIKF